MPENHLDVLDADRQLDTAREARRAARYPGLHQRLLYSGGQVLRGAGGWLGAHRPSGPFRDDEGLVESS